MKPILGITMGDVNGVGPEILAKAFARPELHDLYRPIVFGSAESYERARLSGSLPATVARTIDEASSVENALPFLEGSEPMPTYRPGTLDPVAGRCAMEWFREAVALTQSGQLDGVVTCPINKECIHRAGYQFEGHTDFIAELTDTTDYRMSLFAGPMRVVHNTAHVSLRQALDAITVERVFDTVRIAHVALERLALPRRRIALAGLNPHAGEAGAFGREEIDVLTPVVERCAAEGIDCHGPVSPDAVFRALRDGTYDLVVALYHDQGHIPMKLIAMDEGVNITLGLPIVRTSVDHGTAYDIAGTGTAREHSLVSALALAAQFSTLTQGAHG